MIVLKFGGTSMGTKDAMNQVIKIASQKMEHSDLIIVVSAMSGTTDTLLNSGKMASDQNDGYRELIRISEERHMSIISELIPTQYQNGIKAITKNYFTEIRELCNGIYLLGEISPRVKDRLAGYGELISSNILATVFNAGGTPCAWKDAREMIRTNSAFGNAAVDFSITNEVIREYFLKNPSRLSVVPGFIAADARNISTTLGRGGSDYSAAIIAAAVDAESLEIWTDVSGMMTADPRWVPNAKIIPEISYQEAMELSHFGAKVIYPPTIQPVLNKNIPAWIKNTFHPDDHGTVIRNSQVALDQSIVRGISSISDLALLSLEGSGMVGIPGFSKRLFEALAREQINVILITQSSSEHSICVGIDVKMADHAKNTIDSEFEYEIVTEKVNPLFVERDLSIVALVGDNMKNHTGISGKLFSALGRNGVNIRAIAQGSSERNISVVIGTSDVRKSVNILHEEFFETTFRQINLFISGVGNVGRKFIGQLLQQKVFMQENLLLQVNVVGMANSRIMRFKEEGIDLATWEQALKEGESANIKGFADGIISRNLRNSIFVDITANAAVADIYPLLLEKSIAVVACNKVAASSAYFNYKKLKDLSAEYNAPFLFETNVGAGLPVIATLKDLIRSGDRVHRMQAVLSGTLNFVFNNYDGTVKFADVVKQAQDEGYTEPDPRLDLSGTDVMRKILILAREAGAPLEMEMIGCTSFLPESCFNGSVDDFYLEMARQEEHFKNLFKEAVSKNCKLKFVATFENGKASVGLQHIAPSHDLYNLFGKDNVVLFYTDRYKDQPLVVKGAGAGAEVTASGVFADMLRAASV